MAINTESVKVAICDGCNGRTYAEPGSEPAVLHGEVWDRTGQQTKQVKWSACKIQHVQKAITEALRKHNVAGLPVNPYPSQQAHSG